MVSQGDAALKRQLQRAFKQINQAVEHLETHHGESQKIIFSVSNLCEQFSCCKTVQFETTPLKDFKDMKQKLLIKLSSEIEQKIHQLRANLSEQETFCRKITKQRHLVCELYRRYSDQLDLKRAVERTATHYSLADMIEWVIDADQQLYQQFCCKQYLLDCLQYHDTQGVEKLKKLWTQSDQTILNNINKTLDSVNLFTKEDL